MPVEQLVVRREGIRLSGRPEEPLVPAEILLRAIPQESVESFRPLLPVGYKSVVEAYRKAALALTAEDLSTHYTEGLNFFHGTFMPYVRELLKELSGGEWDLTDYLGFAAGSDVDMIGHIVEMAASRGVVTLFPGDWVGFEVGSTYSKNIRWSRSSQGTTVCLCVPSVRNGHITEEMKFFLHQADNCLLNLNLYPTLLSAERRSIAGGLQDILEKSAISISFSRGFGLTASQLGVILIHKDHPWVKQFRSQWNWFTYFYNAIAAKAFMEIKLDQLRAVDDQRREWVSTWLRERGLPDVKTGSYYVKSFQVSGDIPQRLSPLVRDRLIRLCFKPIHT